MGKIVTKEQFVNIRTDLGKQNKKIILCHGVFDLIHPGHIIHFEEAKALGDILVVSVTAANYVRKGPGRPYFNNDLRLLTIAALECVDYVILSENYTVDDIIKVVKPSLYVKGQEYANADQDITGKITEEVELVKKYGGDIFFTTGQVFSSTKLINNSIAMSDEVKEYIVNFKKQYSFNDIREYIEKMIKLKVLVLGDVIMDEYVFCSVQGMMSKDMGYSARFLKSERHLGGSVAVARHISEFVNDITLTSIIGKEEEVHSRLLNDLSSKMRMDLVYSDSFQTIVKKRYISENEKREEIHKIFVINNLSEPMTIEDQALNKIKENLNRKLSEYDVVVICDFGHGLVDSEIINIVQEKAKYLILNCQTNSSNMGMNLITKYTRADAFALDQRELKLAFGDYSKKEEDSLPKLSRHLKGNGWLTQGSKGAMSIENGILSYCPAFTLNVKDTIGAGDAFFSLSGLATAVGAPFEIGTFLGNIAGALASNIIGNRRSIEKIDVLKFASTLLNI